MTMQQQQHQTQHSRRPAISGRAQLTAYIIIASMVICNVSATTVDTNQQYCGPSWTHVSRNNCNIFQPCGSDDDCTTDGHFCFGDTLCDATPIPNEKAIMNARSSPSIASSSSSSTMGFCGIQSTHGLVMCNIDHACYTDLDCTHSVGETCLSSDCHLAQLDVDDPTRYNSCGVDWDDANEQCGQWCYGDEEECPTGEGCFGFTSCFNDGGLGADGRRRMKRSGLRLN